MLRMKGFPFIRSHTKCIVLALPHINVDKVISKYSSCLGPSLKRVRSGEICYFISDLYFGVVSRFPNRFFPSAGADTAILD